MKLAKRQISWKKVAITVGIATLFLMIGTIVYDRWRITQGWCAIFYSDGSREIKYGDDCLQKSDPSHS